MKKKFLISPEDIKEIAPNLGGCIATDRITVDGEPIRYMYRDKPLNDNDSGWIFMAGDETEEYKDNPENIGIYDVILLQIITMKLFYVSVRQSALFLRVIMVKGSLIK